MTQCVQPTLDCFDDAAKVLVRFYCVEGCSIYHNWLLYSFVPSEVYYHFFRFGYVQVRIVQAAPLKDLETLMLIRKETDKRISKVKDISRVRYSI